MLTYLDLEELEIKTISLDEQIITKGMNVKIDDNMSVSELSLISKAAAKTLIQELETDKIYNFGFDILSNNGILSTETFETLVNFLLAAFFNELTTKDGRARERRLDVPDNLKENVHCSRSMLKNAINHRTIVDKFQLEIVGHGLVYILVGDFNE